MAAGKSTVYAKQYFEWEILFEKKKKNAIKETYTRCYPVANRMHPRAQFSFEW